MTSGSVGDAGPATDNKARLEAELAQARRERDAALAAVDARARRERRGSLLRRWSVGLLVALAAILIPVTVTATWAHRTVLNTDSYVKTVAPIAKNPTVTATLARIATDQLVAALDPQQKIAAALPPKAAFLAGPITNGVKGFVQDKTNAILNTPQFQQLWVSANRIAHTALMKVLRGDSKAVVTTNGEVVLSLVPLLNQVLQNVQSTASDLLGKDITLPQLTGTELPSAACAKLSEVLSKPLPATCGQIPLFPAAKLDQAQWAVRAFDRVVILLLVLTPLLVAAALWLSRRRRRTLLQLTVAAMLLMVVVRRTVMWLQNSLVAAGRPENEAARSVIVHDLLRGFFTVSAWVLVAGLVVLVVATVTGPYAWAVRTRASVRSGSIALARLTRGVAAGAQGDATGKWIAAHLDLMRIAGGAVALLVLLAFDVSFAWLLVVLVLLALFEFWLYRLGKAAGAAGPAAPPPTPPAQAARPG